MKANKLKSTNSKIRRSYDKGIRLKFLGYKSYSAYLRSDHWKNFRKRYFTSNDKKCAVCGVRSGLELHHKNYSNLGREKFSDVVCLCEGHHKRLHTLIKNHKFEHSLRLLKNKEFDIKSKPYKKVLFKKTY